MFDDFGINAGFVEDLHAQYRQSPQMVEEHWRDYFAALDRGEAPASPPDSAPTVMLACTSRVDAAVVLSATAFAAHIVNTGWLPCRTLPARSAVSVVRSAGLIDWNPCPNSSNRSSITSSVKPAASSRGPKRMARSIRVRRAGFTRSKLRVSIVLGSMRGKCPILEQQAGAAQLHRPLPRAVQPGEALNEVQVDRGLAGHAQGDVRAEASSSRSPQERALRAVGVTGPCAGSFRCTRAVCHGGLWESERSQKFFFTREYVIVPPARSIIVEATSPTPGQYVQLWV